MCQGWQEKKYWEGEENERASACKSGRGRERQRERGSERAKVRDRVCLCERVWGRKRGQHGWVFSFRSTLLCIIRHKNTPKTHQKHMLQYLCILASASGDDDGAQACGSHNYHQHRRQPLEWAGEEVRTNFGCNGRRAREEKENRNQERERKNDLENSAGQRYAYKHRYINVQWCRWWFKSLGISFRFRVSLAAGSVRKWIPNTTALSN